MLRSLLHKLDIEGWKQHEARTNVHRKGEAQCKPIRMKERQHTAKHLVALVQARQPLAPLHRVRAQVAVGGYRTLRFAGGASRVLQHGDVADLRPCHPLRQAATKERLPRAHVPRRGLRGELLARFASLRNRKLERKLLGLVMFEAMTRPGFTLAGR